MIFADKLIRLRKKNGWSQEELAERMDVSRQSVSKWESAQSMPDIERLLQLSSMFGVSLDYLLKDEIEDETAKSEQSENSTASVPVRSISREEAEEFLEIQSKNSVRIAIGVFLCVIAAIPLLLLGGAASAQAYGITENIAAGTGISILLVIVGAAVGLFVTSGIKNSKYEFLEKEPFKLEHGLSERVRKAEDDYRGTHSALIAAGCILCVLSPIPLFIMTSDENDFLGAAAVSVMLFIISIAVFLFVNAGTKHSGYQKLLKEGDYREKTPSEKKKDVVFGAYWLIITAAYLTWSFVSGDWSKTWIVWPIAGVLCAAAACIMNLFDKNEE